MILHAFYNKENIGDILLVRLTDERKVTFYKREDDICVLYNENDIIGYNIFNASSYFMNLIDGKVKMTPDFVDELNQLLSKYNFTEVSSDYDDHFIVGQIIDLKEHPDSDHMHICKVDVKSKELQIVCGAPNVALNQLVVVATIGAVMPSGLIIKPSKLRGVDSDGMLCSAKELNLPNAPKKRGILVLDSEKYCVGDSFFK